MPALELVEFAKALDRVAKKMPDLRRELNTRLAELAKEELDAAILASGVHDDHGHVRSWQVTQVGSGGGYGAVHPAYVPMGGGSDDSPAAITYYLDQGRIRSYPHSPHKRRHRKRKDDDLFAHKGRVPAKNFYHFARLAMKRKAVELAEQAMRDIAKQIGG